MRIELTTSAWKAEVLPLNYTRICDCQQQYRSDFFILHVYLFFVKGYKNFVEKKLSFCKVVKFHLHNVKYTIQYNQSRL